MRRAHPHSRGENVRYQFDWVQCLGSSPLTRGKRRLLDARGVDSGLIPTHAGKTHNNLPPFYAVGAHPHSRGENL